jgi:tripartite-type tricarboxylate transporter receptor subunit TctC
LRSAWLLRPSQLPASRRLRSLAPRSLATVIALSNSEMAPSTWRTSLAVGVSSMKEAGLSAAIRSMPRSRSLAWLSGSFIVHPYQYKKLPYDPSDLVPVARFSSTILGVGVPASMNIATLADFVKRARAEAGKFNSAAVPGITDLAFDYFAHNAKITTTKVPYKDIVQAVNDLAEDRLQVYSASYAILRPQREAGRITVLAQMGRERAPSLLDIPTGIEAGFPELEMDGNVGLFGSRALSAELRERIGADVVAVSDDKAIDDKLNATAQTPSRGGAKEFAASIERQRAQIATIAKALGIQPTR